jgi:hypothetical protein
MAPLANVTPSPSYPRLYNLLLMASKPNQYIPLNGTSRHNVGPRPLYSDPTPWDFTICLTSFNTELNVCGLRGFEGVAWSLVRISSSGEEAAETMVRATTPDTSGAILAATAGNGIVCRKVS